MESGWPRNKEEESSMPRTSVIFVDRWVGVGTNNKGSPRRGDVAEGCWLWIRTWISSRTRFSLSETEVLRAARNEPVADLLELISTSVPAARLFSLLSPTVALNECTDKCCFWRRMCALRLPIWSDETVLPIQQDSDGWMTKTVRPDVTAL